ncbi:MAG: hypothetical protein H6605_06775 [Flavobacteriales bacterium]|nr:hypothetical protein [Flavobacteriales bacterium]
MVKRIIISVVVLLIMGFVVQLYLFNKPHKNIAKAKEDFVLSSAEFYREYSDNEEASNQKYLEKVIVLEGNAVEIQLENEDEPTIAVATAEEGINIRCGFKKELINEVKAVSIGNKIRVKGKCDGMDMFGIVMTQCSFVKK